MKRSGFLGCAVLLLAGSSPVWGLPENDDFADAILLEGASGRVTASNLEATTEPGEPLIDDEDGNASLWWRWVAPRTEMVTVHTAGSSFDTLLGVYTGSVLRSLVEVGVNDDANDNYLYSLLAFPAVEGTTYHFAVDGFDGEVGDVVLAWVSGGPPNDDFADAQLLEGPSGSVHSTNFGATLEAGEPSIVDEDGNASVWWQWVAPRTDTVTFHTTGSDFDTLLAVYTGSSLSSLALQAENDDNGGNLHSLVEFQAVAGTTYRISVDGFEEELGNIFLGWATGRPANDLFGNAEPLGGPSGRVSAVSFGATREPGEPVIAGVSGGRSVWFSWRAERAGRVTFHTAGSGFDTLLGVYTGTAPGSLTLVAESDDMVVDPGGGFSLLQSRVDFDASAGTLYRVAIDGPDGDAGNILLTWLEGSASPPANDFFAQRSRIEGEEGVSIASNTAASREAGEPDHGGASARSLWWSWTAPADGELELSTFGSTFDTVLAVYTGESLAALQPLGRNDDAGLEMTSALLLPVSAGKEHHIAVDGAGSPSGIVTLGWLFTPGGTPAPRFLRGDCNGDGVAEGQVTDAVFLLNHNFLSGPEPPCLAACDANGDGAATGQVTDAVYLLSFNFLSGPPPVSPFPACGAATLETDEALGCERSADGCE